VSLIRLYVAVTDNDWSALHVSKPEVEEVNFWRPSPEATFKALQPGELLLFKPHSPNNIIAGGGFFTQLLQLSVNLVWDTFGEANGVRSQSEMPGSLFLNEKKSGRDYRTAVWFCLAAGRDKCHHGSAQSSVCNTLWPEERTGFREHALETLRVTSVRFSILSPDKVCPLRPPQRSFPQTSP
jgi:hypothetical protein